MYVYSLFRHFLSEKKVRSFIIKDFFFKKSMFIQF